MIETFSKTRTTLLAHAHAMAASTASEAGVTVRVLETDDELTDAYKLYIETWRPTATNASLSVPMLRVLAKSGNYIGGAYIGTRLVGMCVSICGIPAKESMHSHVTVVSESLRGRKVGQSIKFHQRAWAIESSIRTITWTVDPLVRSNAYFNIRKLGALPSEYLNNFYGQMGDEINGSDYSDRLLMTWDLHSGGLEPDEAAMFDGSGGSLLAPALISISPGGEPQIRTMDDLNFVSVPTPERIDLLRRTHPEHARSWRLAVRAGISAELAKGSEIVGFTDRGSYIISRELSQR